MPQSIWLYHPSYYMTLRFLNMIFLVKASKSSSYYRVTNAGWKLPHFLSIIYEKWPFKLNNLMTEHFQLSNNPQNDSRSAVIAPNCFASDAYDFHVIINRCKMANLHLQKLCCRQLHLSQCNTCSMWCI